MKTKKPKLHYLDDYTSRQKAKFVKETNTFFEYLEIPDNSRKLRAPVAITNLYLSL